MAWEIWPKHESVKDGRMDVTSVIPIKPPLYYVKWGYNYMYMYKYVLL